MIVLHLFQTVESVKFSEGLLQPLVFCRVFSNHVNGFQHPKVGLLLQPEASGFRDLLEQLPNGTRVTKPGATSATSNLDEVSNQDR